MVALKALYEADTVGHDPELALTRLLQESPLPADAEEFASHLVQGVPVRAQLHRRGYP